MVPAARTNLPTLSPGWTILLVLFFLMTVAVVIWTSSFLVITGWHQYLMRNSTLVPAQIISVKEELIRSGDGTRLQHTVDYRYEFQGQEYRHETTRLGLFGVKRSFVARLDKASRSGESIPVYVAESRPDLSYFSIDSHPKMYLASALFPVGFGLMMVVVGYSLWFEFKKRLQLRRKAPK